jgi:hypothetical protein
LATLENQRIQLSKSFAAGAAPLLIAFTPGGDDRIRTGDPLLAKQVLSQLSYIPSTPFWWAFLGSNQGPRAYQARALAS